MPNVAAREENEKSYFTPLGLGLGLRAPHFDEILNGKPRVSWFEVISENFMGLGGTGGGLPIERLVQVREKFDIVMHGVSLNIGSSDKLDLNYLATLKKLAQFIEPKWVSDHICWNGVDGKNTHDLLPLPYTKEALAHVGERIQICQDYLGRRMVFENVSSYVTFKESEMPEWDFVAELAHRTGCGLLLDVNNVYVSSFNHHFDPLTYLQALPKENVAQIHLAGHSNNGNVLIDTHDHPVSPEVWSLYGEAVKIFGNISTMVERDDHIPDYQTLENEVMLAKKYQIEPQAPVTRKKDSYERIAFT